MIATMEIIPAVAYLRRSTDRQEQSLADQRAEIMRWAGEQGYEIIGEFVDDAISGTSADERPGFQKMIADAQRGGFEAVVVWNSDRFSRGDVTETEYYRYLLRKAGVVVLSVTEDYLSRDHVHPISRGGRDRWNNVVAACKRCNQHKGNRLLSETGMELLALPFCPNTAEYLALINSDRIRGDQMEFLRPQFSRRRDWDQSSTCPR